MLTQALNEELQKLCREYKPERGTIGAHREAIHELIRRRRDSLIAFLEGYKNFEPDVPARMARLNAELTLLLIVERSC